MEDRTGRTVAEVAEELGITPEAVRKRIARGTLEAEKGQDNTWTVYLDQQDKLQDKQQDTGQDGALLTERIDHLQSTLEIKEQEIKRLERIIDQQAEESRRKDTILLNLTNRIPQLEAPKEEVKQKGVSWFNRLFKR